MWDGPLGPQATWRYYPTVILQGDGKPIVFDGNTGMGIFQELCPGDTSKPDNFTGNGNIPAVLDRNSGPPSTWTWNAQTAVEYTPQPRGGPPGQPHTFALSWYPFSFLLSDGSILQAGYSDGTDGYDTDPYVTRLLDPTRTMWQTVGATSTVGQTAVFFQKLVNGEIRTYVMKAGGNGQSGLAEAQGSDKVYMIDVTNPASLSWTEEVSDPLPSNRVEFNLIAPPSGRILAVGGLLKPPNAPQGPNNPCDPARFDPILRPALFDPYAAAGSRWSVPDACLTCPRAHHAVSLLLPDGSVWSAGGDFPCEATGVRAYPIYKPAYFFQGARPTITGSPEVVIFGNTFLVQTLDAQNVTAVRLIRPGAVTHSFDQNQRMLELAFTMVDSDTIRATAPQHGNIAPPGYCMLFAATGANGALPSESRWLRLKYYTPVGTG